MKCNNCNERNSESAKFCTNCGVLLTKHTESYANEEGAVDRYFSEKRKSFIDEAKDLANGEMKQGVIWFILGLIVTFGTFIFASEGETYYILWGAMIYGCYKLIRGIYYKLNPESLLEKAETESNKGK